MNKIYLEVLERDVKKSGLTKDQVRKIYQEMTNLAVMMNNGTDREKQLAKEHATELLIKLGRLQEVEIMNIWGISFIVLSFVGVMVGLVKLDKYEKSCKQQLTDSKKVWYNKLQVKGSDLKAPTL